MLPTRQRVFTVTGQGDADCWSKMGKNCRPNRVPEPDEGVADFIMFANRRQNHEANSLVVTDEC